MDSKEKYKFKKFIKELSSFRGRHTELVSVYIPEGYDLNKIINHLAQEQGTASNIKDKATRTHVIDSLERLIRHLRLVDKTPKNGLAVFSGNISESDNKVHIEVFSIEPPKPLKIRIYRCDQTFVLDPLIEMIESKQLYGLVVMDRRDGCVGLLKGTQINEIAHLTSGVPGKSRAGGQCIIPDTLIQANNGEIIQIKDSHNPYILKTADLSNFQIEDSPITDKWETKKSQVYKIITKHPRTEIQTSKDHLFFVREDIIKEKPAEELKIGDYLLIPEKIEIKGENQNFGNKILPKDIAQILGYFLGDGSYEIDRLNFHERDKEIAKYYQEKIIKALKINTTLRFRKTKNYYLIRTYSRELVKLFKKEFPEITTSKESLMPSKILKSKNKIVATFLKGFFDAEGYVSRNRIGLGVNNKLLAQQLQFVLLRFGILSSLLTYDNRRNPYSNNIRYSIDVSDIHSLKIFNEKIGFTYSKKKNKLELAIKEISKKQYKSFNRQIIPLGTEIRKILEQEGYIIHRDFLTANMFLQGKRKISKQAFKTSILDKITNKNLKNKLSKILQYQLIPVKIKDIQITNKLTKMVDISVKNQNFIANGLIVHNSAKRFESLREIAAKEFYKRIGEIVNKEFLPMKELKGIIVGGPGQTKNEFVDGHSINNQLKEKIIGIFDLSYTGEFGLQELVEKSRDLLIKEEIMQEKEIMGKFLELLSKEPEKTAYGITEVKKALELGAVDTLLISESVEESSVDQLEELAEQTHTHLQIISVQSREGVQLRDLGGIAAILRFRIS